MGFVETGVYITPRKDILEDMIPAEQTKFKLEELDGVGQNVHPAITFRDGKLTCQLQVGHPKEPGSVEGCFSTHLVDFVIELHQHYQNILPSRETALVITKLEEARLWQEKRKMDREKRGVLQTDKE